MITPLTIIGRITLAALSNYDEIVYTIPQGKTFQMEYVMIQDNDDGSSRPELHAIRGSNDELIWKKASISTLTPAADLMLVFIPGPNDIQFLVTQSGAGNTYDIIISGWLLDGYNVEYHAIPN